jgi:ribonuclease P protein subunit POP4
MSDPTPETLTRHELAGLHAAVVDAANPDLVGVAGRVVRETRSTLHLEREGRVRVVPTANATLRFALPTDEAAAPEVGAGDTSQPGPETAGQTGQSGSASEAPGGEGVAYVTVDGARLESRPARRTEDGGVSRWH